MFDAKFSAFSLRRQSSAFNLQSMLNLLKGELRHRCHSEVIRPRQPENDNDLHPLRARQDGQGAEKPPGFLNRGDRWISENRGSRCLSLRLSNCLVLIQE